MKFLLFTICFAIVACNFNQKSKDDNKENGGFANINFSKERLFLNSELIIGRRICSALKKKREFFQTLYDKKELVNFVGSSIDCQGINSESTFTATVGTNYSLEFISIYPRANYFRDIITDQSPGINDICNSIQTTDNLLNTENLGNIKFSINFVNINGLDRLDIKKETKNTAGVYSVSGAESITVITDAKQMEEKFVGVEKERTRYTKCDNGNIQSLKQVWNSTNSTF